ncbi:MAG: hypothetical protein U0359_40575 [Byssovorax sp.]
MRPSARSLWTLAGACLVGAAGGCGGADPPFEELPLRDALTASPEAIAALAPEARKELGERMEQARAAQLDGEPAASGPNPTPAGLVRALDAVRELRGEDALVVAAIEPSAGAISFHPLVVELEGEDAGDLPPLEGAPGETTSTLEEGALDGRAGKVASALLHRAGAHRLVRVSAWPAGAVAADGVVYVNASWLVALAALDPEKPSKKADPVGPTPPPSKPAAVGGNPYLTYGSLDACTKDVSARCEDCLRAGGCDARATLSDFPNGEAECRFLAEDPDRPRELCALALLSISTVTTCMRDGAPSCALPASENTSSDLPRAAAFLSDGFCVSALDTCLAGGNPGAGSGGTDIDVNVSVQGCQNPFTACTSAFTSLEKACKAGSCTGSQNSGSSCTSCSGCKPSHGNASCGGSSSSSSGSSSGTGSSSSGGGSSTGTNTGSSTGTNTGSSTGSGSGSSGSGSSGSGSSGSGSSGSSSGGGSTGSSGSCSSCNSGSSSSCSKCGCGGSSGSSGSNCKCQTEDSSPAEPLGAMAWLFSPLVYVLRRGRRAA